MHAISIVVLPWLVAHDTVIVTGDNFDESCQKRVAQGGVVHLQCQNCTL